MELKVKAAAKINIFLDILGKLDNGYHSLFMVMQSVGLYDELTLTQTASGIKIACNNPLVPIGRDNLVYKAADLFFKKTGIDGGLKVSIDKNIPMRAGLAGGSADAAGVLAGLNAIYDKPLSERKLRALGLEAGSDVPFCLMGGTCLAQNTGGVLSPLVPVENCYIVLAKPNRDVSTAEAYSRADEAYLYHLDCNRMLDSCEKGDFDGICRYAGNVFEQVVEVPERVEIKRIMRENGSSLTQMSGSGPTVFGLFRKKSDAENAAEEIKKICDDVYVTVPVEKGTEIL